MYAFEISMAIDEEFGIDIPDEVVEKFKKVSDIVNFVDKENE